MSDIRIYIAMHIPSHAPQDDLYIPLQVGAANHDRFCPITDADGDSISQKNSSFCELTGLYWIWKNVKADAVGLVHYRRYFIQSRGLKSPWECILTRATAEAMLRTTDVILPKEQRYVVETNLSQYAHAHNKKDLLQARACIRELCPEYLRTFDLVMHKTHGHRLNMMIMKKPLFDEYCAWLFPIIFRLEGRLDTSKYSSYNQRVYGFIAERLLDVWVEYNCISYTELPVVNIEPVRWVRKAQNMIKQKYEAGLGTQETD